MPDVHDGRALTTAQAFQADLNEYTPNLEQALPAHVSVEKFKRVLITAVSSNPDLLYANRRTLFTAAVRCASDGLMPDGRDAALVVYNTKMKQRDPHTGLDVERRVDAVQYLPMIAGIRRRMRNTGDVLSAEAHVVHEGDTFSYKLGDEGFINHEPAPLDKDPGKPLGAYAIIKLKTGEVLRDVMRASDIERSRKQSRAPNSLMWRDFTDEAWRKTVLKRCSKSAPQSSELEALLGRDEEPPLLPEQHFPALLSSEPEPPPEREDFADERQQQIEPVAEDEDPVWSVIDLDGVEHGFGGGDNAAAALIAVLEAAAGMGADRLAGAWESNEVLATHLPSEFFDGVQRRLLELQDALKKPPSAPPASERPSEAPAAPPASPPPPARATRAAAPPKPEPGPELAGEPKSLAIVPPLRRGLPDWRTWSIALFLPKVRQAKTTIDLAYLCGDNDENLTAARASLGKDDVAQLNEAIQKRYEELDNAD